MTPGILVGLCVAGALGATARYLLDGAVQSHATGRLPWGTFVVNVTGSLLAGLVTGAALYHALPTAPRVWLAVGFAGSYTTFSALTFETVRLIEEGTLAGGFLNAVGSLVVGTAAAAAGLAVAAAL